MMTAGRKQLALGIELTNSYGQFSQVQPSQNRIILMP